MAAVGCSPRVYLVTAGTSIADNLAEVAGYQWAARALPFLREPNPPGPQTWPDENLFPVPEQLAATLTATIFGRTPDGTDRALCAELSTLYADGAPHPREEDRFVLLTSDTTLGERCARMVATRLSAHRAAVEVEGERSQGDIVTAGKDNPTAIVARIKDLVPDDTLPRHRAFANLAWAVRGTAALAHSLQASLIVHPTGGFKATLPVLITLLGLLPPPYASLNIEMWTNHQNTPMGIRLPLLQLGQDDDLRRRLTRDLNEIQQAHDNGGFMPTLESGISWKDVLWEEDDPVRLTAFGDALLTFLS